MDLEAVHQMRLNHVSGSLPIWPMPAIIFINIEIIIIIISRKIIIIIANYQYQDNSPGVLLRLSDLSDINDVPPLREPSSQLLLSNLPPGEDKLHDVP